jgi:hypothetical protein
MKTKAKAQAKGHDFGWALQQMRAGKAVATLDTPCDEVQRYFTLSKDRTCFLINDLSVGNEELYTEELLSTEWVTVEKRKYVSFSVALAALKKGKHIARKGESPIVKDEDDILYVHGCNSYTFTHRDVLSNDWYIL